MDHAATSSLDLNDRSPTVFGWVFALLGSGGLLFFWAMGAVVLVRGDSGTIVMLELDGVWRALFLAYPFVFVGSLVLAAALAALKRDLASVALAGAPVALAVLYYLGLLYLRPL